jgi:hypothetical protein
MSFAVDSRRTVAPGVISAAARRGATVNAAADRVGRVIAGTATDLARLNQWPAVPH